MKFIGALSFLFFSITAASAEEKSARLNFNTYVRENYQILSKVKRPDRPRLAFQPEQPREPAVNAPSNGSNTNAQNPDYGVDKNGNVSASKGSSLWGAMSGQGGSPSQPAVAPTENTATNPASSSGSSSSSSSSSSSGESGYRNENYCFDLSFFIFRFSS